MSLALAFWIVMLIVLIGAGWAYRSKPNEAWPLGVLWILVLILGWATFGAPIK